MQVLRQFILYIIMISIQYIILAAVGCILVAVFLTLWPVGIFNPTLLPAWRRRRLNLHRIHLADLAGRYGLVNLYLFQQLLCITNLLQTQEMQLSLLLAHDRPHFIKMVSNRAASSNPVWMARLEITLCCNLYTLCKAMALKGHLHLIPYVAASINHLKALNVNYIDNNLYAVMLSNGKTDRREYSAIIVRKTANAPDGAAFSPVTLSFFVQSYSAAQQVQGLLLLLGDACIPLRCQDPLREFTELGQSPEDTLQAFRGLQNTFKNRAEKPDVEIHLDGVQTWNPVPRDFVDKPVDSPEAWQTLANVFQNLEIHPAYGRGPKKLSVFNPSGPTLFGTLRVHHGIFVLN